ncbi:type IV pilus modification protein PilV [Oxalobacteraceae bacterium OM1]|nr:type IV pilus modification protein PilV [Oxalobacteraceae bacterium OM1]
MNVVKILIMCERTPQAVPRLRFKYATGKTERVRGFSMIETLVALVVLAIGVLGAAGLQLASLRSNKEAGMQTGALELAADIAEELRIRSAGNPAGVLELDYNASEGLPNVPTASCYDYACAPDQAAEFIGYAWKQRLLSVTPVGRIRVCADAQPWHQGQRSYAWECTPASDGKAPLVVKLGWPAHAEDTRAIQGEGTYPPRIVLTIAST